MTRCRRCNRQLKTEPWASQEIGRICASKEAADGESKFMQDESGDVTVPYDGGDIWIERLAEAREDHSTRQLKLQVDTCSGIRTNVVHMDMSKSPGGFNYGYGGSGPSCFALNIMLMFCKNRDDAQMIFQDFKRAFVVDVPQEEKLVIKRKAIINFIHSKKKEAKWLR